MGLKAERPENQSDDCRGSLAGSECSGDDPTGAEVGGG